MKKSILSETYLNGKSSSSCASYDFGFGRVENVEKAWEFYRKSIYRESLNTAMELQYMKRSILSKEYPNGKSSSCTTVGADASYALGFEYEMGFGRVKNVEKALELYIKSAQENHLGAIERLYTFFKKEKNVGEYEKLFVIYLKLSHYDPHYDPKEQREKIPMILEEVESEEEEVESEEEEVESEEEDVESEKEEEVESEEEEEVESEEEEVESEEEEVESEEEEEEVESEEEKFLISINYKD